MNLNRDFDLLLYGVILVVLGVLGHLLAPGFGYAALVMCVAGGVLAAFWGVLGLRGFRRRIYPIGTLVVLDIGLLALAIKAWLAIAGGAEALNPVAIIMTMLLVFGVGQLVNFLQGRNQGE